MRLKEKITRFTESHKLLCEILRFLIVGGCATIIDFLVMSIVLYAMEPSIYPKFYNVFYGATGEPSTQATVLSTGAGFIVGLIFNYIFSIIFVFEEKGKSKSVGGFVAFSVLSAIGLLIHIVGMYLGYDLLGLNEWGIKVVLTIVVLIYNYITRKLLLFKNKLNKNKTEKGNNMENNMENGSQINLIKRLTRQNGKMEKITIIAPCYNEEETVETFYNEFNKFVQNNGLKGYDYELILVNDGSKDRTIEIMKKLASNDKKVKIINFSRNFGQQAALLAGFENATGDAVVNIDVDLQDPIEAITDMITKWEEGYDVVHGRRLSRAGEGWFKKKTSAIYLKFLKKITHLNIPQNVGEFKLLDRKVVDVLNSMQERNRYLRSLVSFVGFKQTCVDFERRERCAGKTKYSLKKMVDLAKNGIIAFSNFPLYLPYFAGFTFCGVSVITYLVFIILACCKVFLPVSAWLFPTIFLLFGIAFVFDGIKNEYTVRIYDEAKQRPIYIVDEKINF